MEKKGNKENNLTNYLVTELLPSKNNQLLIFSSPALAENAYNELKKFFEKRKIYLLPHSETLPYDFFSSSANVRNERMRTLSRLLSSQKLTLVTSIHSIVSPCPDRLHFLPVNNLKIRNRLDRKELIVSLKLSGYERKELVSEVGEFSVRGSVIDVFTTGLKLPVRIEIYENKVESLRFFNPITQLTTTKLESLSTLPPHEYPLNEKGLNNLKKNWRNIFETYEEDSEIFQNISQGKPADGAEMYLPLFFNQKTTPVEYLYNFKHVFIDPGITKSLNEYELLIKERFEEYRFDIQRPLIHPKNLFLSSEEFYSFLERRKVIKLKVKNLQLNQIDKSQKKEIRNFNISSHTLPKIGELVVHLFHGIGIYKGLRQFSANGIIQDCLEIQYLEESKVYVPVESMHLVSKYFGASNISLDRLGSKKWQKKKIKAIKKTFDIAAELLGIQAKREAKKGLKYEIPKKEYEEFSKEFPYVETVDQHKSILEIETDLKNLKPMDRLVCGEVGFG